MLGVASSCTIVSAQVCPPIAIQNHLQNLQAPLSFSGVPDAELAVGTTRILTCTNSWFRLHDKNGTFLTTPGQIEMGEYWNLPGQGFFQKTVPTGFTHRIVDPVVYFDHDAHQFYMIAVEVGGTQLTALTHANLRIAVSTTATPTNWDELSAATPNGHWRKYTYDLYPNGGFNGTTHNWTIYVDDDTVYISVLHDQLPTFLFRTTSLIMLDLMAGVQAPLQAIHLEDPPHNQTTYGHAVAVEYDVWNNNTPVYTVVTGTGPNPNSLGGASQHQDTILVGAIMRSGTSGNYTYTYDDIPITGGNLTDWFDTDRTATGPNNEDITIVFGRFFHATFRPDADPAIGGRLYTCHHVNRSDGQNPASPVDGREVVRWYEIHTKGWPVDVDAQPIIANQGEIDVTSLGMDAFDPSIAANSTGHIGLSWTQAGHGAGQYPEFWMGTRGPTDPTGFLDVTLMQSSAFVKDTQHKADYSGTDPNPTDPCVFWGHSMLATSDAQWDTYLGRVCVVTCDCDCYADQDESGDLNVIDPATFIAYLTAGDPIADCDGNGVLDTLDLVCFDAEYAPGCEQ